MKRVFYIPMSTNVKDNEDKINDAIQMIGKHESAEWLTNLITAPDPNKYMLVADIDPDGTGTEDPEIGVKVIMGSYDAKETEEILNNTLAEMEADEDKTFISISCPIEHMYIILYSVGAGEFPRVKIFPNLYEHNTASRVISAELNRLDEDDNWGLTPYHIIMINNEYMMILFSAD